MAEDAIRMIEQVTFLKDHFNTTRTHYVKYEKSEDGQLEYMRIHCAGAPSTDFNSAPLDSTYIDTTNHKEYIKTAASTWTVKGAQTA